MFPYPIKRSINLKSLMEIFYITKTIYNKKTPHPSVKTSLP